MPLRKTLLTLPFEVAETFTRLNNRKDTESRDAYISQLRAAQWTLQSIADASGLTRERVRQISKSEVSDTAALNLPTPTPPLVESKPPRTYVEPSDAIVARLKELKDAAQKVTGSSPNYRAEAEEYTKLIYQTTLPRDLGGDGVPLYRLAKRIGATHSGLRNRLVRYGYKTTEGKSKAYATVKTANRV